MDDLTIQAFMLLGVIFIAVIGFGFGRWRDAKWQCNRKRQFFRKPYFVLAVRSKDRKHIFDHVVTPDFGILKVGKQIFHLEKGKIYLESDPNKGFKQDESLMVIREGAPTLFVDYESGKPLPFIDQLGESTEDGGPAVESYINAKVDERIAQKESNATIMLAIAVLTLLVAGGVGYILNDKIAQQDGKLLEIKSFMNSTKVIYVGTPAPAVNLSGG